MNRNLSITHPRGEVAQEPRRDPLVKNPERGRILAGAQDQLRIIQVFEFQRHRPVYTSTTITCYVRFRRPRSCYRNSGQGDVQRSVSSALSSVRRPEEVQVFVCRRGGEQFLALHRTPPWAYWHPASGLSKGRIPRRPRCVNWKRNSRSTRTAASGLFATNTAIQPLTSHRNGKPSGRREPTGSALPPSSSRHPLTSSRHSTTSTMTTAGAAGKMLSSSSIGPTSAKRWRSSGGKQPDAPAT
jgi:hypothetical protein